MKKKPKDIMSLRELCSYLGITKMTYYNWIKSGDAPQTSKIGRRVFVQKSDIIEWLNSRKK
jgi:excisionase family DNA binding protein